MIVYITKYALTDGILEVDAVIDTERDMVSYKRKDSSFRSYAHGKGRDWHESPASAYSKFEFMRARKIETMKKKISKLEAMQPKLLKESE
jgi:hypothetical protein